MGDLGDDHHPSVDEVVALRRRVAELEQANRQLSEQLRAGGRQPYEDLLENMNDIIYTTDRAGNILSVNQAIQRILGFAPQEVVGTHYSQWLSREDFDRLEAPRPDVLQGHRKINHATIHGKQGNARQVEISVGPLLVGGRIEGTQGIIRDVTARHEAERKVRESEERLRSLFNATTESIILIDAEGTMLAMNETAARRLGKSIGELVGTNMAEIGADAFPESVVEYRKNQIRVVLDTKQPYQFEDVRAGQCFHTSMYPICDEQGKVRQIAIFGQDITERKRAEEEIKTLQRRIEFILDTAKTRLSIADEDYNLQFVDATWRRRYGDSRGKKCYEYFRGTDHLCPECGVRKALATKQIVVYEGALPKEGNRPTQVTAIPFQTENGTWLVAEVSVDITERKLLEQKLRESEQRYRTVVENAGETIAVVDAQGVFQFLNTTAARRLGGQPADFQGRTMWELFPQEIADRQVDTIRKVIRTGTASNTILLTRVGSQWRWYDTTVEPLKDGAGAVTTGLVIARDIHELKTAQQELETYRENMIRAEHLASLGTLSAMLSHEMTQPLTIIRLSIQNAMKTLEGASPPPTVLEDLKDGLDEIATVTAIVDRFRTFARRASDETISEVSLSVLAGKVMGLLGESARKARIILDVHSLAELPPIRTCAKAMEQIFFALAQNAIHAAQGQGDHRFRVTGALQDHHVELRFADDCGGIAPEVRDHLFEPFFTTKPPGTGTGLGLCLVQRLVSRAGGHLTVDNRWGEGTTFVITLPQ